MSRAELPDRFVSAALGALGVLGPRGLGFVGADLLAGKDLEAMLDEIPLPELADAAESVLDALKAGNLRHDVAGAYLSGLAEGHRAAATAPHAEVVWSGPSTARVPVRATARVLLDVVNGARSELLLMTYSAKPYEPLIDALAAAGTRGVRISAVVETLQGAGSAIQGAEPAAAYAGISGIELWHWPLAQRMEAGAKMHAKLAVADESVLFTTSANLTESGIARNIESGVLVQGGAVPRRAAEHIRGLQTAGILCRYH